MSAVKEGVRVKVKGDSNQHIFKDGIIAVSTGEDYGVHAKGQWSGFRSEVTGNFQWLLPEHYEVINEAVLTEAVVEPEEADEVAVNLPKKAVYVVISSSDEVLATTADREYARELKAALGGKRKGTRIFQYTAVKEIR